MDTVTSGRLLLVLLRISARFQANEELLRQSKNFGLQTEGKGPRLREDEGKVFLQVSTTKAVLAAGTTSMKLEATSIHLKFNLRVLYTM